MKTIQSTCQFFSFSNAKTLSSIQHILKHYSKSFAESQAMQQMIPRQFSNSKLQKWSNNLRFTNNNNHIDSLNKTFSEPIWDLLDRGGKRWRPVLCMLIAEMYGHRKEKVFDIAALCQIVHNGTLIVDDIQDASTIRRNKPCVHLLYGNDVAVNAGNLMYFVPMLFIGGSSKYTEQQKSKLNRIYVEEMVQLHIGQGWDILWHNIDRLEGKFPTQEQYLQMTAHKTGVLARLSARMVCTVLNVSSKETEVLIRFVQNLGVAFQIQDDLLNLQGEEFVKTKGYSGEDIHEGKITLMVIHHLQKANILEKDRLIQLLKKRTQDKNEIAEAIKILKESGSFQYARNVMHQLIDSSFKQIQEFLPNNEFRDHLKQLAQFGISRKN